MHIILLPLIWLAYQDIQEMQVGIVPLIIFCATSFLGNCYFSAVIMLIILSLVYMLTHGIAFADIVIMVGCANFLQIEYIGPFLLLTGLGASIFAYKNNKIPLIPFILFSFLLCIGFS